MSTPYIGEIRLLPYMRGAPSGWQICDGSLLQISGNEVLYTLLGTTYGGDGVNTFGVPDLRGRVPIHQGSGAGLTPRSIGQAGGTETVTLNTQQMAPHVHYLEASTTPGTAITPVGNVVAAVPATLNEGFYATNTQTPVAFPATTLNLAGAGNPHDNTAPTLALQYCIATEGIFPQQS